MFVDFNGSVAKSNNLIKENKNLLKPMTMAFSTYIHLN